MKLIIVFMLAPQVGVHRVLGSSSSSRRQFMAFDITGSPLSVIV